MQEMPMSFFFLKTPTIYSQTTIIIVGHKLIEYFGFMYELSIYKITTIKI